jgi:hypothetical protein
MVAPVVEVWTRTEAQEVLATEFRPVHWMAAFQPVPWVPAAASTVVRADYRPNVE